MKSITISSKYQIVVPSAVRAKLGVGAGDRLVIARTTSDEVVLKKEPKYKDLLGTVPRNEQDAVQRVRQQRDAWR